MASSAAESKDEVRKMRVRYCLSWSRHRQ